MISVILYGRNDSYGYNLQKRAAISLNCFAEILSDPDDEILFVDCNTANELPTFIESIYDILTPGAKSLLRVLRVRPELHQRLVGHTHLMVVEPQPRNIAIRRSNPRNYWILNTNTDVILLPHSGFRDLTEVVHGLADGLYTLPRFELPEPLWEAFPRTDPAAILQACRSLGPRLHLDEVTLSFPESRYDQVGDFQLAPRQALWDIHGFDERMIYGWHCDSNVSKRLNLYYGGRTESLAGRLKAYHCDHTRVATGMHAFDMKLDNNAQQFVFAVEDPFARHQADTWGLPDEPIEELDFARDPPARYAAAVERTLCAPQQLEYEADSVGVRDFVSVQAEHVLPYLASDLTVYRNHARFAYIGNHPRLLALTARCITELGFESPLEYATSLLRSGPPDGAKPIAAADLTAALLENYDLLIFDLSLDREGLHGRRGERVTDWPRDLRHSLGAVARCLETCAERARAGGTRVPEFMVINANHHTFWNFVNQFLLLTATPYATHVRKGRPRLGEECRYRSNTWKQTEDTLRSFFGYDLEDASVPAVALDRSIDFTSAGQPGRFKDGDWGAMDYTGTWTDGERAIFEFQPPAPLEGDVGICVRVNEALVGPEGEPVHVEVLLDGVRLAHWSFFTRYELVDAKAIMPAALLTGKSVCRLEFHVENPQSAARLAKAQGQIVIGDDPRMLGFKVQRLVFTTLQRLRYNPGEMLEFTARGTGAAHTNECWSLPNDVGVWSLGPRATLTLLPSQPMEGRAQAIFTINDVAIGEEHPTRTVRVSCNGQPLGNWTLIREVGECLVLLPADAMRTRGAVTIAFEIDTARTPANSDCSTRNTRPLGFQLSRLRIAPVGRATYRIGETIDFVEGRDFVVFVGDAAGTEWSQPGPRGSWTLGNRASFRVPFEQPAAGDLPAAFVISDCMLSPSEPKLAVTVRANGHAVAEWVLEDRRPHRRFAAIPAAVAAAAPGLTLTFEIATPRSPKSLGWNADSRLLGFQLARAVIGRNQVEIPKFKAIGRERPMHRRILGLPQYALHVARILAARYLQ